jgi:hypothetical protein
MSYWTHVNGTVRFDYLEFTGDGPFDDDFSKYDIPEGSEGPLEYNFDAYDTDEDDDGSIRHGQLTVWGDLRDFDTANQQEVVEFLTKCTTGRSVRQGVCQINDDVFVYGEEKGWQKVH